MTPTNHDIPEEARPTRSGAPYWSRLRPPIFAATAAVLLASGGIGAAAASAASAPAPVPTPTASETPSETPSATPSETPTDTPTETPTETPTDTPTETPTEVPETPAPVVKIPAMGALASIGAMHGEFAVASEDGCASVTVVTQTGQATAVAEDSITVTSRDGYAKTYAVGDDTRVVTGRRGAEKIKQDDWVSVTAATENETANAAYVFDLTRPSRNLYRTKGWWYSGVTRSGKLRWRAPAACPTPSVTPTPTLSVTPPETPPATPSETPTVTPPETPTVTPSETPSVPPSETPAPEATPTVTVTVTVPPSP